MSEEIPEYFRPTNRAPAEVLHACAEGVKKNMDQMFGEGTDTTAPPNVMAQIAVALLQLSMRYFGMTGAPKRVVLDLVLQLLGMRGQVTITNDGSGADAMPRIIDPRTVDTSKFFLPDPKK